MKTPMFRCSLALCLLAACGGGTSDTPGSTGTTDGSAGTTSATTGLGSSGESSSGGSSGEVSTGSGTTVVGPTTGLTGSSGGSSSGGPPDGSCRGDADCDAGMAEFCFAPDEVNCGDCQVPGVPCDAQMLCEPGFACVPFVAPCACEPGAMECVAVLGCLMDADCMDDALFCSDKVCAPKTCDGQMIACPELFDCVAEAPGDHCQRRMCSDDGDCGGGFCVEGRCFAEFGMCQPPAP